MGLLDKDGKRARGDCWNTPQHYIDALLRLWPDGIDLDPCSNPTSLVPAARRVMLPHDGLCASWNVKTAFVNPPWSNPAPWYERAAMAFGDERVVVLTHVATGSQWWQQYVWPKARAICFHSPRLAFLDEAGTPIKGNPRDCASTYYGPDASTFQKVFSALGHVVML